MINLRARSDKTELLDTLEVNEANVTLVAQNLKEFSVLNRRFGTQKILLNGLNKIYNRFSSLFTDPKFKNKVFKICDVGCGGGDLTKAIYEWAKTKHANHFLISGVDINPLVIQFANENISNINIIKKMNSTCKVSHVNLQMEVNDVFSEKFLKQTYDIICFNNICHHFATIELQNLLAKLAGNINIAIIINDLQRHWLAYYFIKLYTKIFNYSSLAKHDGPLSVLKAFTKKEIISILNNANITQYELTMKWPFRWQLIIWNKDIYV